MKDNLKIGVLIPAYNEGQTIGKTIEDVLKYSPNVVVVDDGSKDRTSEEAMKYPVKLIPHGKNKGLAAAVRTGLAYMLRQSFDYAIKIDGDSQMDIGKIPVFIKAAKENPLIDIIYATFNPDTPWMIKKDMRIYSFFLRLATGHRTSDILSEYRMYSNRAMEYIVYRDQDEGYGSPLIIIDTLREGFAIKELGNGVSYAKEFIRPFPLDAQLALRRSFVIKVFRYKSLRSKIVAILSIPFFAGLLIFNVVTGPKYHSILPKRFLRK